MIVISVSQFAIGDRVIVDSKQGTGFPEYFLGTVTKVGRYPTILYDDGEVGESRVAHLFLTTVKTKNKNQIPASNLSEYGVVLKPTPVKPIINQPSIDPVKNPTGYAQQLDLKILIKELTDANVAYHNGVEPKLSDRQFDLMMEVLKSRDPVNSLFKTVGAPIRSRSKVQLPIRMTSLDKIKDNADSWLTANKGPYVVMDKLDGVSLEIDLTDGLHLYTRGDGSVGQDITHLAKYLVIPPVASMKRSGKVIRAEILMSKSAFSNYEQKFANPRNLVSGLVNKKEADISLADASVVAYEIMGPRYTKSTQLEKLKSSGFDLPWFLKIDKLDTKALTDLLVKRKSVSKFELDGLVVEIDKVNHIPNSGNPSYAVAFKDTGQNDSGEAEVTNVEWNVSRGGLIKPTVLIKTIKLAGVKYQPCDWI